MPAAKVEGGRRREVVLGAAIIDSNKKHPGGMKKPGKMTGKKKMGHK